MTKYYENAISVPDFYWWSNYGMHIFCDESGGFEKGLFTVCSVCIDPKDANHIIKDMRKKFKLKNEIKGSSLTTEQRSYF